MCYTLMTEAQPGQGGRRKRMQRMGKRSKEEEEGKGEDQCGMKQE